MNERNKSTLGPLFALLIGATLVACTATDPGQPQFAGSSASVDEALTAELLTQAAEDGENDIVRFALASGANIDARDPSNGKTPLILAAERGHVRTVALLIESGARIDRTSAEQWTPLVYAAARGRPDVARLLIGAGADIEVREPAGGYTPLMIASLLGQTALIAPLVDAGAEVNALNDQSGANALGIAAGSTSDNTLATLAELIVVGASPNTRDNSGTTPLMAAVKRGDADAVNLLLNSGADPGISDEEGQTALDIADARSFDDISELIKTYLDQGAT